MATADTALNTPTRSFIYGLADDDGLVDTEFLYAAAEAAGFSPTKLRLALKRMAEDGLLTSQGRGRKAVTQLTPEGLADRSPDLAWVGAAYRADAGLDLWDGLWHLASFEIPERNRAARDAVRNQIIDLFGGQLSGGLYLSPLGWEPWIAVVADAHGVGDRITMLKTATISHAGLSEPSAIAAQVWPVDQVHRGYAGFVSRWRARLDGIPEDRPSAVRLAFEAADEFEAAFRADPLLPSSLVPADFAGPSARRLFLELLDTVEARTGLANANLFSAYRTAVERALAAEQDAFWQSVFAETVSR